MQKKISFRVNQQKIQGTLLYPNKLENIHPAVIFIHGWTSSEKGYIARAKPLLDLGYICLTFNMRGHGDSDGNLKNLSRNDHLEDCKTAYDFLAKQNKVNTDNISVVGSSYGGYLASLLSSKRNIASLVLKAPAIYKDDKFLSPMLSLINQDLLVYRQKNIKTQDNLVLKSLAKYTGKILLIECEKDEVIPKATLNSYIKSINPKQLTHKIILGADHSVTQAKWNNEFISLVYEWFKNRKNI